jgi:CTP synthase
LLDEQRNVVKKGATMRLGAQLCEVDPDSHAARIYEQSQISERHRHRYEFNPAYRQQFQEAGLIASGFSPDRKLVEIVEIPDHPWFVAVQFHPEFKTKPYAAHPLFSSFVGAAVNRHHERMHVEMGK